MIQASIVILLIVIVVYLWKGRKPSQEQLAINKQRDDNINMFLESADTTRKDDDYLPPLPQSVQDVTLSQISTDIASMKDRLTRMEAHESLLISFVKDYIREAPIPTKSIPPPDTRPLDEPHLNATRPSDNDEFHLKL
jgi:hypothetical protein